VFVSFSDIFLSSSKLRNQGILFSFLLPVPVPVNVGNRYAGKGYPVFASVLYIFILYTLINMVHFPSTTFPNRRKKARTSPCRTLYLFVKHSQIKFVQDDFSIRCVSVIHCFGIGPAWCVDKC
jgi:hypothetical protein